MAWFQTSKLIQLRHFTAKCLATWPLNGSEAGVDFASLTAVARLGFKRRVKVEVNSINLVRDISLKRASPKKTLLCRTYTEQAPILSRHSVVDLTKVKLYLL